MYLLDTNTLRAIDMGDPSVMARAKQIPSDQIFISVIAIAEVLQGWLSLINKHQGRGKTDICAAYDDFDEARLDLNAYKVIRHGFQAEALYQAFPSSVKRAGTNDCRIAATAIVHGLIVVTRNTPRLRKNPRRKIRGLDDPVIHSLAALPIPHRL